MIITTTPSVEGYKIVEYKGITYGEVVSGGYKIVEYKGITYGEVVSGVNFFKDFAAGLSNKFCGRSNSYEDELKNARERAL